MLQSRLLLFLMALIGVSSAMKLGQQSIDTIGWFNRSTYKEKSKADKLADLWEMISRDTTPAQQKWMDWFGLFATDMSDSFLTGDEMKDGRPKLAHQVGIVANATWVPTNYTQGYSGIMSQEIGNTSNILLRLSETTMLHEKSSGLLPSLAMKFLRDGVESDNIVAMPNFTGVGKWDFFAETMKTRVTPFSNDTHQCEALTIQKKLVEGQDWAFTCGIANIFLHYENGTDVATEDVNFPYELAFEPFNGLSAEYVNTTDGSYTWYDAVMDQVGEGDTIFTVYAATAPYVESYVNSRGRTITNENVGEWVEIAHIVLESNLTTSLFGDERLFFSHQRAQIDREYWDSTWTVVDRNTDPRAEYDYELWAEDIPEGFVAPTSNEEAYTMFMDNIEESGCPFQWLLDLLADDSTTEV